MGSIGAEEFRALARSAPWRWRELDVTVRRAGRAESARGAGGAESAGRHLLVRAQLRRGEASARVVDAATGQVLQEARPSGLDARSGAIAAVGPEGSSLREATTAVGPEGSPRGGTATIGWTTRTAPEMATPLLRDDGLVAARPHHVEDPPLWQDYHWVATFDPVELADGQDCEGPVVPAPAPAPGTPEADEPLVDESGGPRPCTDLAGTEVGEVRVGEHHGRATWTATLRPTRHYEPRCGCCALLPHPGQARREWGDERAAELGLTGGEERPEFEAALDVATGVLVHLSGPDGTTDVEIHSAS